MNEPRGKLTAAAGPLLSLLVVIRRSRDLDALSGLRATVDRLFQDFRNQARNAGIALGDADDAAYALAAAFDEALLTARWSGREEWLRNPLARQYCNDEFVGIGFYDRLTQVRRSSTPRPDVVEVFYYCLVSGFRGKLVENPKELNELLADLAGEIGGPAGALSPEGYPNKDTGRLQPMRKFPWPAVVITCVFLPLLVWLLAWNGLDHRAGTIVRALQSLGGR
jgi:type VI secretion system protein ImpK